MSIVVLTPSRLTYTPNFQIYIGAEISAYSINPSQFTTSNYIFLAACSSYRAIEVIYFKELTLFEAFRKTIKNLSIERIQPGRNSNLMKFRKSKRNSRDRHCLKVSCIFNWCQILDSRIQFPVWINVSFINIHQIWRSVKTNE